VLARWREAGQWIALPTDRPGVSAVGPLTRRFPGAARGEVAAVDGWCCRRSAAAP
jgi:hypothetical protein